jgi:hypothetical protein
MPTETVRGGGDERYHYFAKEMDLGVLAMVERNGAKNNLIQCRLK